MPKEFTYNRLHRVVVCQVCKTCLIPGRSSIERHLRGEPHRLLGPTLKSTVEYLFTLELRTQEELRMQKPVSGGPRIEHLEVYDGYRCLLCKQDDIFCTIHLPRMEHHMLGHERKAKEHKVSPLWEGCTLQTYFTAKGRIDYFIVAADDAKEGVSEKATAPLPLTDTEKACFEKLEKDYKDVQDDIQEQASVVHDFGDSKSARVPWLERLAFPSHLVGLKDDEIKSSYELPRKNDTGKDGEDADLHRLVEAADAVFRDAYQLCSDTSPDRKMTQQRANILNEFYAGASGKADGFRYYKNASTLTKYFTVWKQLVVYYFRVVYREDGHFTRAHPDQKLPGDIIQPTAQQTQAMDGIIDALSGEDEQPLKHAVRRLCLALVCQTVGSVPFRSPVLSFSAMLSRKLRGKGKGQGLWMEPGNFNSYLSALTWTAQLIIFDYACFQEQEDEDHIPAFLTKVVRKFFQQLAETPFGHILQWRLFLFKVSKGEITKHQAIWALDGQSVVYRGLELHMSHVPQLIASEYQQAHALLYDELMFRAVDLTPMQSWRLEDDLDLEDFAGSWLSLPANAELVQDTELALFRRIQADAELRAAFLTEGKDGSIILREQAMDLYEVHAQAFLKRALVLCHVPPGQPLRESELLSVMVRNTARRRHLLLWQKQVMIHTQYHKGQQQSGVYKENIRFLPKTIGDLLLDYLAYVLPLRQLFLRQRTPGALISPYLWAKLDGTVWPDGTLSTCLSKACARAMVPRLHTSNWRQISATICKEKFSVKERANFDLEDGILEDTEDELDLVAMAEQGNHSYATFNHAYAGSTTLTMNALLHRNHRASQSWHTLFRFDSILHGKRPRPVSGTLSLRMLSASKRGQLRRKGAYSEADLLDVARKLHNTPDLQLRVPGQRHGLLATIGPRPAEQVVLVAGTGSGKSLVFMVGAAVADARTTILVLPMVALRGDMLRRCLLMGIRPLIWSVDVKLSASLVVVSAEAVCTPSFLNYAHGLVRRQELDRIVIDECQLTVSASDYRPCMSQLGWYIRQIRTQTLWLTATLPPAMQELFIEQNKLVRPKIIRESTNRPNIKYMVSFETGAGTLVEKAAQLVRSSWPQTAIFDHARDKIIIYCRTRDEAGQLAELLQCSTYTSRSGSEEQKATIISTWLRDMHQPMIAATSALGVGFDYPHVRWVVHVDAPDQMSDFSQESGRAGRDGRTACSIVMLRSTWKPQVQGRLSVDQEAMQLYLTQGHCSRGVLSQFLDNPAEWRWCMGGDEACQVCRTPHVNTRPLNIRFTLTQETEVGFTGPGEVLRQDHLRDEVVDRYEQDLEIMKGICLHCRAEGRQFNHLTRQCARRFDWINAKKEAYQTQRRAGKEWIERYAACWKCYQPQEICRVADPEHEESECRFPDMVMPLCYGVYCRAGGEEWLQQHFQRRFRTRVEYMIWLGETASLEGNRCIQANCVAAVALAEFS